MNTSLAQLDPQGAWQPAPEDRWNLKWAAHLYRRAAFCVPARRGDTERDATSWDLLQRAVMQGRDAAVAELLTGGPAQDVFDELLDGLARQMAANDQELDKLEGWWLYRMVHSPQPLRERMTLVWHNHFATSVSKVRRLKLMLAQNQLMRRHALGRFPPMLEEMGRDAAMLVWLDGANSIKGQVNENYGRELLELFALGVGNYSERDVQEAARAFTGWTLEEDRAVFKVERHDDGDKTVLGQTGKWRDSDVVRIVLEQPATARHLARRLFREFISEAEAPPDALVEPLADHLRKSQYDIASTLGMIFRSNVFSSEQAWRARVRSPVEHVVGLLRTLNASVPVEDLASAMEGLGQTLFSPPNVKGWEGGRAWLNSATLLARHNLAWRLVGGHDSQFKGRVDVAGFVKKQAGDKPEAQIEFLLNALLDGEVSPQSRKLLAEFASQNGSAKAGEPKWLAELVHTILMMPEYQLA